MHAVRFHSYGDPSVLQIEELPVPEPGPNQVRIRVVSSSINPADVGGRAGIVRLVHARTLPHTPGNDVAGVIDALGPGVAAFLPGERVYAMTGLDAGGQAEYICVETDKVAPAPSRISLAEAGAVPLAGLTALQALRGKAHLQSGQRLLVNGASGGVGSFAVQIGKAVGCHVTAVCRGSKAADMRELGADEVIDYKAEDFAERAQTWDVVFDAAGNRDLRQVQAVLTPQGFMVATRPAPADLALNALHLAGHRPGYAFLITQAHGHDLALLTRLIDQGAVRPLIDRTFSMDEIQEAHRYFEKGDLRGKIVVQVGGET